MKPTWRDGIEHRGELPGKLEGRAYWRAIEELLDAPGFRQAALREFPFFESDDVAEPAALAAALGPGGVSRREFLRLMGASVALAGMGGCLEPPRERILPYTERPRDVTPGVARYYATAMPLDGYGTGLLVESHEGRPTKVEGNPAHPASFGAAGVYEQASVLQLYDPQRARGLRQRGAPRTWAGFAQEFAPPPVGRGLPGAGVGLRFLLGPTASPLTNSLIGRVRDAYPRAGFVFYSPLASDTAAQATRLLFGRPAQVQHDFRSADVVVALDADFLASGPFHLRYARDWAERRRPTSANAGMSRLYVAEGAFTPTGATADHRLRVRPSRVGDVTAALLAEVVRQPERLAAGAPAGLAPALATRAGAATAGAGGLTSDGALTGDEQAAVERWVRAVARDLHEYPGRSIIMAGERQTAWCTRVAQALNALLGNVGRTVRYTEPVLADAGGAGGPAELSALVAEMRAGVVDTLVVLEGNPVYDSPADLEFANALSRVRRTVYLGLYENETAAVCDWFIPALHYLERWGDSRAWDGTAAIIQPLIRPLYDGRSADDVLATFAGLTGTTTYDLLRQLWMQQTGPPEFDAFWEDALRRGVVSGTESAPLELQPQWDALNLLLADLEPARIGGVPAIAAEPGTRPPTAAPQSAPSATTAAPVLPSGTAAAPEAAVPSGTATGTAPSDGPTRASPDGAVELAFLQSASVYDGRFANNAWLQELPDPLTKLTWDNAAVVSPRTAARLGLEAERVVELRLQGRQLTAPVFILPGQADDLVTLALGYGRRGTEAVARGVGANAYTLRTTEAPYFAAGVTLTPLSTRQSLATTQTHWTMAGRPIVLSATLDEYRADPEFTRQHRGPVLSLYRPFEYDRGDQWSMAIDLATCIGCNACVVACQAENNIPVVGKGGVLKSREMHWLRIDRYFDGTAEEPGVVFQPMLCQHCEKAPCEYVCPVNATVHSPDGLNEMIYNRCVGTRFCSNNCPYKVRRFNWLDYNAGKPETLDMAMNPDVTVRARGVMEKCTFCVQRIRRAQQQAAVEGRRLQPGEVRTACQQACSTQAIWFGSYTDPDEELLRRLSEPRRYAVLNELGTEPRVKYLARITNPGGDLEGVYAQPPAASPPTSPGYAPGGAPGAGQR